MTWLEPWWSTEDHDAVFHELFRRQLECELMPGHALYGVPVRLIARGKGDDALFELNDGTDRVARVQLTWETQPQTPPCPGTSIFVSFDAFAEQVMLPEHAAWTR